MSLFIGNQPSTVLGRRQNVSSRPRKCPRPKGRLEAMEFMASGKDEFVKRARDAALRETYKSHSQPVSSSKQDHRLATGKPSLLPSNPNLKPIPDKVIDDLNNISLDITINQIKLPAPQSSLRSEDRHKRAVRHDDSRTQSYWDTPNLPQSQVPPARIIHSVHRPRTNNTESCSRLINESEDDLEEEMEEEVKILKVAFKPVRIIRGHVWQNVQPQVATIVDPSMEESSSDSEASVKEVFVKQPEELHQNVEVVRSVLTARDRWTTLINSDKWNTNKAVDMEEEAVLFNERPGRKLC
ncbi:uncharacterized protein FIESC28_10363 [Fusarium coffeatum]|uniref:Uncharacterized protein n=1 Tax=Fusarium coffeatum TaxID=231269 RepID=A0A366QTC9_9HYPO|nr:uncharacterized protein FIESC28_10363 [Fusarium coffeatum]RBR08171.1 hypothetical protein FIESC28_10363 [Fusarium coffeatum]